MLGCVILKQTLRIWQHGILLLFQEVKSEAGKKREANILVKFLLLLTHRNRRIKTCWAPSGTFDNTNRHEKIRLVFKFSMALPSELNCECRKRKGSTICVKLRRECRMLHDPFLEWFLSAIVLLSSSEELQTFLLEYYTYEGTGTTYFVVTSALVCFKQCNPGLCAFHKNWLSRTQPKRKDPKFPLFRSKIFAGLISFQLTVHLHDSGWIKIPSYFLEISILKFAT